MIGSCDLCYAGKEHGDMGKSNGLGHLCIVWNGHDVCGALQDEKGLTRCVGRGFLVKGPAYAKALG